MPPLLLVAVLLTADPAPPITLPALPSTRPGRLLKLSAQTQPPGKPVRWTLASDDADLVPFPDGSAAVFSAPKPGRYLVLA
ncbi:MAG: hypothetical protein ACRCZF_25070, partial [Gemmataceae bacterium]